MEIKAKCKRMICTALHGKQIWRRKIGKGEKEERKKGFPREILVATRKNPKINPRLRRSDTSSASENRGKLVEMVRSDRETRVRALKNVDVFLSPFFPLEAPRSKRDRALLTMLLETFAARSDNFNLSRRICG